jgi:Na+/H+ antiporter NhaC
LERLITPVIAAANSIAALIAALASAVLATAEQYFANVLPGRMFKAAFEKRRLAPDRFPGRSVRPELPRRRSSPGTVAAARW